MKNDLDSRLILSVFEKIHQHGESKDEGYFLGGIQGYSDFDGYTIFLQDALVKLSFGFHNQYHYEYLNDEHREQFEKKLKAINAEY